MRLPIDHLRRLFLVRVAATGLAIVSLGPTVGCKTAKSTTAVADDAAETADAAQSKGAAEAGATVTAKAPGACEGHTHEGSEGSCGNCGGAAGGEHAGGDSHTTRLLSDRSQTRTHANGRSITHVGGEFVGAPQVTVADILSNPEAYRGKTIRVSGNVSAMCVHRRAWFAVVGDDSSGRHLRVITAPSFLVPQGSIGKTAVAEGVVELVKVSARTAKHWAEKHKLDYPEGAANQPLARPVLRASGSEFM